MEIINSILSSLWEFIKAMGFWSLTITSLIVNLFFLYQLASKKYRFRVDEFTIKLKIFEAKIKVLKIDNPEEIDILHQEIETLKKDIKKLKNERLAIIIAFMLIIIIFAIKDSFSKIFHKPSEKRDEENSEKGNTEPVDEFDKIVEKVPIEAAEFIDVLSKETKKKML
jgi:hypothetical protein